MQQIKRIPGISFVAQKARLFLHNYKYRKPLLRIKKTKEMIIGEFHRRF